MRWLRSVGPAIIVASVVLGPGSILTSSKVGCQYGYSMLWVLMTATVLMIAMVALGARLGVGLESTLCDELAKRCGRPFTALVGITLFLVVASFQSSNNIAVVASLEPFFTAEKPIATVQGPSPTTSSTKNSSIKSQTLEKKRLFSIAILLAFNGLIIATLYGFKKLYQPLEKLMMLLVLLMLVAFGANLMFSHPSLRSTFEGLIPQWPAEYDGRFLPTLEEGRVIDPFWAIQGLIATTFSVVGGFYQAYLVREKGWTAKDFRKGMIDSILGITMLSGCTAMIMITAAAILHGSVEADQLRSTTDLARQLVPLFGRAAFTLFSLGIFAAAFSSFLVNAMIGGTLLSDGFGLGSSMDQPWPKRLTVLALLVGMGVAVFASIQGKNLVGVIIFAQALTVLGVPILAFSMLFLATRPDILSRVHIPLWILVASTFGCVASVLLALRTAWRIYLQLS